MRIPRFRLRSIMIVVAVSALLVWASITGKQLRSKSQRYRSLANQHAASEANARAKLGRLGSVLNTVDADIAKTNERDVVLRLMRKAREELTSELRSTK